MHPPIPHLIQSRWYKVGHASYTPWSQVYSLVLTQLAVSLPVRTTHPSRIAPNLVTRSMTHRILHYWYTAHCTTGIRIPSRTESDERFRPSEQWSSSYTHTHTHTTGLDSPYLHSTALHYVYTAWLSATAPMKQRNLRQTRQCTAVQTSIHPRTIEYTA